MNPCEGLSGSSIVSMGINSMEATMTTTRKETTSKITKLAFQYFVNKRNHLAIKEMSFRDLLRGVNMEAFCEIGKDTDQNPYHMRADIIAINKINNEIVIVEVKSCRDDFIADKKYKHYLNYCNKMYFAIDGDYISKHEIPSEIGIIRVDGYLRVEKKAKKSKCEISLSELKDYMLASYSFKDAR
jgi:hypothetical protein